MKKCFVIIAIVSIFISCSSNPGKLVTKEEYGNDWAFTVDEGYVYSVNESAIFRTDGEEYALNGLAETRGYKSIDLIWRDNPDIEGLKVDIGPFIKLALDNPK